MSNKNINLIANKLVNAFLKSKIISPIPSRYTKKIEQAQKLHDAGMKAHSDGDHSKSEELLNEALDLFKS